MGQQDIKNSAAAKAVARIAALKQESAIADKEAARQAAEMAKMSLEAIRGMNMERIRGMKAAELRAMSRTQVSSGGCTSAASWPEFHSCTLSVHGSPVHVSRPIPTLPTSC